VELDETIRKLLHSQLLGVLATQREGHPYTSLVAVVASDDLRSIWLATSRHSRKYTNLTTDARVALLMDNRSGSPSDPFEGQSVTAIGVAAEVAPEQHPATLRLYLAKHPQLEEFVTAADTALIQVAVERYLLVTQFQKVEELRIQ